MVGHYSSHYDDSFDYCEVECQLFDLKSLNWSIYLECYAAKPLELFVLLPVILQFLRLVDATLVHGCQC